MCQRGPRINSEYGKRNKADRSRGSPICGLTANSPERAGEKSKTVVMAQTVSRRSLAVEAQIRCQTSPYGIFSAKSGTQVFLQALELSNQ